MSSPSSGQPDIGTPGGLVTMLMPVDERFCPSLATTQQPHMLTCQHRPTGKTWGVTRIHSSFSDTTAFTPCSGFWLYVAEAKKCRDIFTACTNLFWLPCFMARRVSKHRCKTAHKCIWRAHEQDSNSRWGWCSECQSRTGQISI
jgi:hypothetical protein